VFGVESKAPGEIVVTLDEAMSGSDDAKIVGYIIYYRRGFKGEMASVMYWQKNAEVPLVAFVKVLTTQWMLLQEMTMVRCHQETCLKIVVTMRKPGRNLINSFDN
jgi:hypothetical protein